MRSTNIIVGTAATARWADLLVNIASEPGPIATPPKQSGQLRLRIISALVLAPLGLLITWFGGWAFDLMVLLAALTMLREWTLLSEGNGGSPMLAVKTVLLAVVVGLASHSGARWAFAVLPVMAVIAALVNAARGRSPVWAGLGMLYVGVPCIAMIWLRHGMPGGGADGRIAIYWLLAVVWATDTGAYFAGRTIGGPKLAPHISPNKTWAGLLGGMVAAAIAGTLVVEFAVVEGAMPASGWLIIALESATLAVIEQAGDLAESAFKRRFHAKDAGTIIPGHGGVLDRLDGLLFAAPVLALGLWLWGGPA